MIGIAQADVITEVNAGLTHQARRRPQDSARTLPVTTHETPGRCTPASQPAPGLACPVIQNEPHTHSTEEDR